METEALRNVKVERPESMVKLSPYKPVRFGESPSLEFSNYKSPDIDHFHSNYVVRGQNLNFYQESPINTFSQSQNQFFKHQGFYSNLKNNFVNDIEEVLIY
jgi:hypothetical protein